jgi:two-component system, OmpR family, sensor histidine kinase KdpD
MRISTTRALRLTIGAVLGSAIALVATYTAFRFHYNFPAAGFIELLVVVSTALRYGFWEATGCSVVAVACLDYFFAPPIRSLHVADPENWVALVAFEVIALMVSRLSYKLQTETRESFLHRRNAEKLFELSRGILGLDRQRLAGPQIASLIQDRMPSIPLRSSMPLPRSSIRRASAQKKKMRNWPAVRIF